MKGVMAEEGRRSMRGTGRNGAGLHRDSMDSVSMSGMPGQGDGHKHHDRKDDCEVSGRTSHLRDGRDLDSNGKEKLRKFWWEGTRSLVEGAAGGERGVSAAMAALTSPILWQSHQRDLIGPLQMVVYGSVVKPTWQITEDFLKVEPFLGLHFSRILRPSPRVFP